jgi:hypothetical protein
VARPNSFAHILTKLISNENSQKLTHANKYRHDGI